MLEIFMSNYKGLFEALLITLKITACSLIFRSIIGLVFAFFRLSNLKILNFIAHGYLIIVRGTSMIVQVSVLYFGISSILTLPQFWAGVIALAVHIGMTDLWGGNDEDCWIEFQTFRNLHGYGIFLPCTCLGIHLYLE